MTRRIALLVAAIAALLAFVASPTSAGAVVPELLATVPEEAQGGSDAGQLGEVNGIAADPNLPGHAYVVENGNNRVSVFTPWGEFLYAFGWRVDAEAPEEKLQTCTAQTGCLKGSEGSGAGQLGGPQAVAVDDEGNVYVAEGRNHRIQKFDSEGNFLAAFGGDVVAHGPDDSTDDEVQQLSVAATKGTFELKFENPYTGGGIQETASLPFNATAAEMEAALNALSTIGGLGGSVSVTGGPGDGTGSAPYEIAFEGNLGGDDVPQLSIDRSGLGAALIGATLRCSTSTEAEKIEYRWLRNGSEILGAESPTYTTTVADEGKSVQCQVRAIMRGDHGASIQAANPVYVAPPEGGTPPPVAPIPGTGGSGSFVIQAELGIELKVGGTGGQKLTCEKGTWAGASSFAYAWYRNGVLVPGATESTYTLTTGDLASPAYFQCRVTAASAGTATTTEFSGRSNSSQGSLTSPAPVPEPPESPAVKMEPPSSVRTANQGGAPEVCEAADICKAGIARQAGGWLSSERYGARLAVSPVDGSVFLGEDQRRNAGEPAHIQVFNSDGGFREEIVLPEGEVQKSLKEGLTTLVGLAVDGDGTLYVGFTNQHTEPDGYIPNEGEVREFEPQGPVAKFIGPQFKVPKPDGNGIHGIAVDEEGNVYAVADGFTGFNPLPPHEFSHDRGPRVIEFDAAGTCLNCGEAGAEGRPGFDNKLVDFSDALESIDAVVTGAACGPADVYTGHRDYFKIFGPPPDATLCPPPKRPPAVLAQYATSVDTGNAVLRAQINPRFWNDTRYYVEYGTAPCSTGGCEATQPAAPGQRLTKRSTNELLTSPAIFLSGLSPSTTYHYRFVAQSSGGGPVRGVGGEEGKDGVEGTFRTFPSFGPSADCPNQDFRGGTAALLPDCRAYEMVSPLDKENGEILSLHEIHSDLPAVLSQSSTDGERIAYGSFRAFGDASSALFTSQYVAARGSDGWQSHSITPPLERIVDNPTHSLYTPLKALSPDLCEAWIRTQSEPLLAPGALEGFPNLYRRTDEECGGPGYEAITTVAPAHGEREGMALRGVSADGSAAIFTWFDNLAGTEAPDGAREGATLYYQREGGGPHYVCVLPSGAPAEKGKSFDGGCAAGFSNGDGAENREDNVQNAISADGSRVFWTEAQSGPGPIYVRENPNAPQSARALGAALGTGDLIGAATGIGNAVNGSKNISAVGVSSGKFAVGQEVSGAGIPAGDKIAAIATELSGKLKLTLEKAAGAGAKSGEEISGVGSAVVTNATASSGAFATGQELSAQGAGIEAGATIVKIEEPKAGVFTLTLSAKATRSEAGAKLFASSECTEAAKACTVTVSAKGEMLSGKSGATYWGASDDGTVAIFAVGSDLYRFDVESETTTLIAHKSAGMMGASEDASRIYLTSEEVLSGANPQGRAPVVGKPNLYLYEGGGFRFVATMAAPTDIAPARQAAIQISPMRRTSRVSPDGLHAAFMTSAQPSGYDNTDVASPGQCGPGGATKEMETTCDLELFVYDAEANGGGGKLACASCNPSGARPRGEAINRGGGGALLAGGYTSVWSNTLYAPRNLSDDGTRLYFNSSDTLTPLDTNGVSDVYQWEEPGAGSCDEFSPDYSVQDEGCIDLISSGQSPVASEFTDASPSGKDAFFTTLSSLLPQDYGLTDLYDARVEGGFPQPPAPAPLCEGEACQGTPEAPNDPTPSSESFQGAGNVREEAPAQKKPSCAKGKVRRHGKCVAKHTKKTHRRAKRNRRAGR
jgi:hypothetical protein